MELETVDTWCADALILPPEPRPDARDSQRSTQADSEASVALTPPAALPAQVGRQGLPGLGRARHRQERAVQGVRRHLRPCARHRPLLRRAEQPAQHSQRQHGACHPTALPRCCRVCTRRALALREHRPRNAEHRPPNGPAPLGCSAHEPPRLRARRRSTASTSRALCWCRTRGACTWRAGSRSRTASERGARSRPMSLCAIMRLSSAQPVCSGPRRSESARSLLRRLQLTLSPLSMFWLEVAQSRVNVLFISLSRRRRTQRCRILMREGHTHTDSTPINMPHTTNCLRTQRTP